MLPGPTSPVYIHMLVGPTSPVLPKQLVERNQGTREITRLDLTIQPLIHDIFSQIIDSSPCFPERFRDLSCMNSPSKQNQKCYVM